MRLSIVSTMYRASPHLQEFSRRIEQTAKKITNNYELILVTIGRNSFLSPNATVCGSSYLGHSCFVGAGSLVTDNIRVPDSSFIKAGRVFSHRDLIEAK